MRATIALTLAFLLLASCAMPEPRLWGNVLRHLSPEAPAPAENAG